MSSVSTAPTIPSPVLPRPVQGADRAAADVADDTAPRALIVHIAGMTYGIPVELVREVVRSLRVTRVPGATTETLGIINLRGSVVTVLDIASVLHGVRAVSDPSIVLIENGDRLVGFAVDSVRDVRAVGELDSAGAVKALDATALCARYLISAEEMGR